MSDLFENVHVYDGRLVSQFRPKTDPSKLTDTAKKLFIVSSLSHLMPRSSGLKLILNGTRAQNYQIDNNLDVVDVLYDVCYILTHPTFTQQGDLIHTLDEQLQDMQQLGVCPSGRVTRVLQVWIAFESTVL
jgi:hypothetical protein